MDRGYIDFDRLHAFTQSMAIFVIRSKSNLDYSLRLSEPVDESTGPRSDQIIVLKGAETFPGVPESAPPRVVLGRTHRQTR